MVSKMNTGTLKLIFLVVTVFVLGKSEFAYSPQKERIYVEDGSETNISLQCKTEAKGINGNDLFWIAPVNSTAHETISLKRNLGRSKNDSLTKTLEFSKFKASEDSGKYICQYQSKSVAEFELIPLAVTRQEEAFEFEMMSPEFVNRLLKCNVKGVQKRVDGSIVTVKSVRWFQNDELVENLGEEDRFLTDPQTPGELSIQGLSVSDPSHPNQYYAEYTFEGTDEDKFNCSVALKGKPVVWNFNLRFKVLIFGEKLVLKCTVFGFPKAGVSWTRDNVVIQPTEDHVVLSSYRGYDNATLTIMSVDYEDAGVYTCTAYEPSFNYSHSKFITVRVNHSLDALWVFLAITGVGSVLCLVVFIYEKYRNKREERAETKAQEDADCAAQYAGKNSHVRNRGNMK